MNLYSSLEKLHSLFYIKQISKLEIFLILISDSQLLLLTYN